MLFYPFCHISAGKGFEILFDKAFKLHGLELLFDKRFKLHYHFIQPQNRLAKLGFNLLVAVRHHPFYHVIDNVVVVAKAQLHGRDVVFNWHHQMFFQRISRCDAEAVSNEAPRQVAFKRYGQSI